MSVPLFTIEQIELIRRLRNSGITKDQVVLAFAQLDRMEAEFGRPGDVGLRHPVASLLHPMPLQGGQNDGPLGLLISKPLPHSNGLNNHSSSLRNEPQYKMVESYSRPQSNGNSNGTLDTSLSNGGDLSPSASVTSPTSKLPSELTIIPISSSSSPETNNHLVDNNGGLLVSKPDNRNDEAIVPVSCIINPHELLQDEIAELEEFKKRTDMEILSEIRNFVMRYNIKQTMIAEMTKMSQAYVSRFFRGDIADMSDRTKHTFYMWYLTCKNNPWKLRVVPCLDLVSPSVYVSPAQLCPNSGVKRMVSETGDLIPLKRERFTFKATHLAVLERYYEKDPYPDAQTREQIVEECNRALGALENRGAPLADRDRVTLPVVNNWFNNRRKEAKKQLRQQHGNTLGSLFKIV
ncbi:hypothetical protein LAZ67_1005938 [Cordylochernes scorpioides]|uniref:Uncharacterized protein n=1 Tax=Cordylochernes scorpioides TaxID=51811 RepID=A0ABY6K3A3_9ARAC|nr:hypothetical protein LAZ67_1005938 [Cordylochernes scorpioides]